MHQWVDVATFLHSDNVLDLVLTSEADRVVSVEVGEPLPGCDHFLDVIINQCYFSV